MAQKNLLPTYGEVYEHVTNFPNDILGELNEEESMNQPTNDNKANLKKTHEKNKYKKEM